MARYWEPFTSCVLSHAILPFLLNVTDYIHFLSNSLSYISNNSYSTWLSTFSAHPYFSRAPDRICHDASLSGFVNIDLWAQSISDPSTLYHPQEIPSTDFDAYYHSAEIARTTGAIRSRMPFKRPLYGGIDPGAHVSPAQSLIRSRFKSAIDIFSTITQTDREAIYDRSLDPARWYFNFFMSEEFALIKRIYSTSIALVGVNLTALALTDSWAPDRTMIIAPNYLYEFDYNTSRPYPLRAQFLTYTTEFFIVISANVAGMTFRVPITLIEFY